MYENLEHDLTLFFVVTGAYYESGRYTVEVVVLFDGVHDVIRFTLHPVPVC